MKRTFASALLLSAALAAPAFADITVNYATNGSVPRNSIKAGAEANGETLFACTADHNGGTHPGKLRPGLHGCNFGYGGQELTNWEYQVVGGKARWRKAAWPGDIPNGSVALGNEANGAALYVCRAPFNGGLHPGKIRTEFKGCNIGYGGQERTVFPYEVLGN